MIGIGVENLTKSFGAVRAVDDLTFTAQPGRVTGFLGPNGAGKTTTLRMLLGLVRPTAGRALIEGRPYAALDRPGSVVGAALESSDFHPGRSGLDQLRVYAPLLGVPDSRCGLVLDQVGLTDAARRRVGGWSLGMRQRLALAMALLGDPRILVLDEPANGLDPAGIAWLRDFLRYLAVELGRTVLVSSHVLAEVQETVDDVVIIAGGRLVHASSLADLRTLAGIATHVASPDRAGLESLAERHHWRWRWEPGQEARAVIDAVPAAEVGHAAHADNVELHLLAEREVSLENVFLQLTGGAR